MSAPVWPDDYRTVFYPRDVGEEEVRRQWNEWALENPSKWDRLAEHLKRSLCDFQTQSFMVGRIVPAVDHTGLVCPLVGAVRGFEWREHGEPIEGVTERWFRRILRPRIDPCLWPSGYRVVIFPADKSRLYLQELATALARDYTSDTDRAMWTAAQYALMWSRFPDEMVATPYVPAIDFTGLVVQGDYRSHGWFERRVGGYIKAANVLPLRRLCA